MKKQAKSSKRYVNSKTKNNEFQLAYEETKIHLKIARLLEDMRLKSGLTQTELAKRAGVSQPMIARLERGDQDRIPTINKIFSCLGYEVDLVFKAA